jgi:predicted RNA binding protein YcfA (HicA-like mRNA interferase family)
MSRRDKRIERLRQNPKNIRFEEIDALLTGLGFESRQRGSHVLYASGKHRITVPIHRPFVKPVYIKLVLQLLEELSEE